MTITGTDVCNMALDLLHEAPLTVYTTDGTRVANWFVRNFAICRDAELEAHPWRFAMTRVEITVDGTAPAFGWSYRYALPTDFMRIGYLNSQGIFEYPPIPHEIESIDTADIDEDAPSMGWILCDVATSIKLVYVRERTDPALWPALFRQALAGDMARKLAHWLTGKASFVQIAEAYYQQAIKKARLANALLSTPERPNDSDVIAVRYQSATL